MGTRKTGVKFTAGIVISQLVLCAALAEPAATPPAAPALAGTPAAPSAGGKAPVNDSVIDVRKSAKVARPGQVLLGQPGPAAPSGAGVPASSGTPGAPGASVPAGEAGAKPAAAGPATPATPAASAMPGATPSAPATETVPTLARDKPATISTTPEAPAATVKPVASGGGSPGPATGIPSMRAIRFEGETVRVGEGARAGQVGSTPERAVPPPVAQPAAAAVAAPLQEKPAPTANNESMRAAVPASTATPASAAAPMPAPVPIPAPAPVKIDPPTAKSADRPAAPTAAAPTPANASSTAGEVYEQMVPVNEPKSPARNATPPTSAKTTATPARAGDLPATLEPVMVGKATDVPSPERAVAGRSNEVPSPLATLRAGLRRSDIELRVMSTPAEGVAGSLQVRVAGDAAGAWREVRNGETLTGIFEFRAGATGETELQAPGGASVRLHRMARGAIYVLSATDDDAPSARRVTIELSAGKLDLRPGSVDGQTRPISVVRGSELSVVREPLTVWIEDGAIKTSTNAEQAK